MVEGAAVDATVHSPSPGSCAAASRRTRHVGGPGPARRSPAAPPPRQWRASEGLFLHRVTPDDDPRLQGAPVTDGDGGLLGEGASVVEDPRACPTTGKDSVSSSIHHDVWPRTSSPGPRLRVGSVEQRSPACTASTPTRWAPRSGPLSVMVESLPFANASGSERGRDRPATCIRPQAVEREGQ